jgi:hypothetical protein
MYQSPEYMSLRRFEKSVKMQIDQPGQMNGSAMFRRAMTVMENGLLSQRFSTINLAG